MMLLDTVRETIAREAMLPSGGRVLVGLSGGADSVALVRALCALGYEVHAFHLNHCLRGAESDRDEAFVRALCDRLGLALTVRRADVGQAARETGESVETAARRLRYAAFDRAADKVGAARIATAHTADDNLETMLFHLIRGTGTRGLAGIPPVRGRIVRPLLDVTREEVEAYLAELGQDYVTDSSNLCAGYTRNRIRQTVVPALRALNPSAAQAAGRAARLARQDDAALEDMAARALAEGGADGNACPLHALEAPPAVRMRMLRLLLTRAGVPMGRVTARHYDQLSRLLDGTADGRCVLPDGFTAYREGSVLRILRESPRPPVPVFDGFSARLWDTSTKLTVNRRKQGEVFNNTFNTFFADCGTIHFGTLGVRTPAPGDRLCLPGARGARSLKRLMTDLRIPISARARLAVLYDRNGVIAVQSVGIDVSRAAHGQTCLEIRFEG